MQDFEVIWIDSSTQLPKDMSNVTLEIYHYTGPDQAQFTVPLSEPYIFTETINDTVNIGSLKLSQNILIDVHISLDLNLVASQLDGLECPPNDYVVPNTCHKVSLVNGYKKYALSACELSTLINLEASGYVAHAKDGFVVITSDFEGQDSYLQIGSGTWNSTSGIIEGQQFFGSDIQKNIVYGPTPMQRIDIGTYVLTQVPIINPPFEPGEKYFAVFRGVDQITLQEEIRQDNFTILKPTKGTLNISFVK